MNVSNCSCPIFLALQTVCTTAGFAISLVSRTIKSCSPPRIGSPIPQLPLQESYHTEQMMPEHSLFGHGDMSLPVQDYILKFINHPGNLWSSNHPPSQSTWIICKANCSSITFDTSIILLVCLVNGDGRKHSLGLLHCELQNCL